MTFKFAQLIPSVLIKTTIASRYRIFQNSEKIVILRSVNIQLSTRYILNFRGSKPHLISPLRIFQS